MSALVSETATLLRGRLGALEDAGARRFAPSACAFVDRLLTRGEALGGGAGARLIARATARAEALGRELETAKTRAREALKGEADPAGAIARAIESGDVGGALRRERKRRLASVRPSAGHDEWLARLLAEARERGLSLAGHARTPGALSAALYTSSRDEVSAMRVALRAEADVSPNAGPYNPLAIASRALAELSTLAPAYLAALVGYFDELAPLLALPPAPVEGASGASRPSSGPPRKRAASRPRGR